MGMVTIKAGELPIKEIIEIPGEVEISWEGDYLIIEPITKTSERN